MANKGLQLLGFMLAVIGLVGLIAGTIMPQWQMSAYVGDNIITAVAMYQGLWMSCAFQSTGQMQCKIYDSMLQLNTLCAIIACSYFSYQIIRDFYSPFTPVNTKYEFGGAIFVTWAGAFLTVFGGGLLAASCSKRQSSSPKYPKSRPPSSSKECRHATRANYSACILSVTSGFRQRPTQCHVASRGITFTQTRRLWNQGSVQICREEMTNRMVITQPQPVLESRESDEWGSGVCDCCDNKAECCVVFWCCPCFACMKTKEYGQCFCLPLLDLCGIVSPATWAMRVSMRHRYGIKCLCLPLVDLLGPAFMATTGVMVCVPPVTLSMRVVVRYKHQIPQSVPITTITSTAPAFII
ncbi:Claudin-7-B [Bagarius yarrelli]|uniref:Claudin-7-B n=1 Tax=Bagarius yarrelli TaxID=175774 RepID=A0A556V529_BAGYA|nr:Claudin-7-B [Bagarius yarrelli]